MSDQNLDAETTAPTVIEREYLLRGAVNDAAQALDCMRIGDWRRADVLLKLATDQIADAGVLS